MAQRSKELLQAQYDRNEAKIKRMKQLLKDRLYAQDMVARGIITPEAFMAASTRTTPVLAPVGEQAQKQIDLWGPRGVAASFAALTAHGRSVEDSDREMSWVGTDPNDPAFTRPLPKYFQEMGFKTFGDLLEIPAGGPGARKAAIASGSPALMKLTETNTGLLRWVYKFTQDYSTKLMEGVKLVSEGVAATARGGIEALAAPVLASRGALLGNEDVPQQFLKQVEARKDIIDPVRRFKSGGIFGLDSVTTLVTPGPFLSTATSPEQVAQRKDGVLTGVEQVGEAPVAPDIGGIWKETEDSYLRAIGIPTDPIEFEQYRNTYPATAAFASEVAYMLTLHYLTGGAAMMSAKTGILSHGTAEAARLTSGGVLRRGLIKRVPRAATGAGIGALIGWNSSALQAAEDPDGLRQALGAARGAALGTMATSIFWGKPIGIQARKWHMLERQGRLNSGIFKGNFRRLGAALKYSPRSTVGYMAEAGLIGGVYTAQEARAQGVPAPEAIMAGLRAAPGWMALDLSLMKLGGFARGARTMKIFDEFMQDTVMRLGIVGRGIQAGAGGVAGGVVAAPIGAAFPGLVGEEDRLGGASKAAAYGTMAGIVSGYGGSFFMRDTVLPIRTKIKLRAGKWADLDVEDTGKITEAILTDTTQRVAQVEESDTVARMLMQQISRHLPKDQEQASAVYKIHAEMMSLIYQLNSFAPGGVVPEGMFIKVNGKDVLAEIHAHTLGRRMMELREDLARLLRQDAEMVFGKQNTLSADPTVNNILNLMQKAAREESARLTKAVGGPAPQHVKDEALPLERFTNTLVDSLFEGVDEAGAKELLEALPNKKAISDLLGQVAEASGGRIRKRAAAAAKGAAAPIEDPVTELRAIADQIDNGMDLTPENLAPIGKSLTKKQLTSVVNALNKDNRDKAIEILRARAQTLENRATAAAARTEAAAAKKVAPAGAGKVKAPIPDSITPGATTRAAKTVSDLKKFLNDHGLFLNLETVNKRRVFVVRNIEGKTVAQSHLLRDVTTEIEQKVKAKASEALGLLRRQSGDVTEDALSKRALSDALGGRDLAHTPVTPKDVDRMVRDRTLDNAGKTVGAIVGGVFGSFAGSFAQRAYQDDDDYTYAGPLMFGSLFASIGILTAYTGTRRARSQVLNRFVKIFAPPVEEQLDDAAVNRLIGRGIRQGGPTKEQFFRFPVERQVEHLRTRITNIANTKLPIDELKKDLKNAVTRYTPTFIPVNQLEDTVNNVIGAALAVGYTDREARNIARGFLANMAVPFSGRLRRRVDPDIFTLAKDFKITFQGETDLQRVQKMIITTQNLMGKTHAGEVPVIPTPMGAMAAIKKNQKNLVTPEATALKELMNLNSNTSDFRSAAQQTGAVTGGPFHALRPPLWIRTAANKLIEQSTTVDVGNKIRNAFDSLQTTLTLIRQETDDAWLDLYRIFNGMHDVTERRAVSRAMEDEAFRYAMMRENPKIVEKAIQLRGMLDFYAEKMGLPLGQRIENYLPWVYSARTIRELQESGQIPTDIIIPAGTGLAPHKVMRHTLARTNEIPLGTRLEDPLELAQIYLTGAIRKIHFDPYLTRYFGIPKGGESVMAEIAKDQPFLAHQLAKLTSDVMGIPSYSRMAAMSRLAATGLRIDKAAAAFGFNDQEFLDQVLNRYFYSPGAGQEFSRFVRGLEFYLKIGGNLVSPMVNMTQLPINTGTELGLPSILLGGTHYLGLSAIGAVTEKALEKGFLKPAGLPKLMLKGLEKRRLARAAGVFSDNTRRILDELAITQTQERGLGVMVPVAGGAAVGGVAGTFVTRDEQSPTPFGLRLTRRGERVPGFIRGLGAGATAGAVGRVMSLLLPKKLQQRAAPLAAKMDPASRIIRRSLQMAKDTSVGAFQMAEWVNRGATAGALEFELALARRAQREGQLGLLRASEAAGNIATGAAAGATVGAIQDDTTALEGAALGAVAGTAVGLAGARRSRYDRLLNEEKIITKQLGSTVPVPGLMGKLRAEGPPSKEDIDRILTRWMLDMTQFRFGVEGRPSAIRNNTAGEVLASLQTFTMNQMEFTGTRLRSFVDSLTTENLLAGNVDTRIFRYGMLVAGTGAALTSTMGFMGDFEQSPFYWMSRIGIGLFPLLTYNESAQLWTINHPSQQILGPFVDDVFAATTTIFNLVTDPIARETFDMQLDDLVREIMPAFRLVERAPAQGEAILETTTDLLGSGLEALGMESLAEDTRTMGFNTSHAVGNLDRAADQAGRPFESAREGR